jgi:hypothetical protein
MVVDVLSAAPFTTTLAGLLAIEAPSIAVRGIACAPVRSQAANLQHSKQIGDAIGARLRGVNVQRAQLAAPGVSHFPRGAGWASTFASPDAFVIEVYR